MEGGGKGKKKAKWRVRLHLWVTLAACGVEGKLPGTHSLFFFFLTLFWLGFATEQLSGTGAKNGSSWAAGAVSDLHYNLLYMCKPRSIHQGENEAFPHRYIDHFISYWHQHCKLFCLKKIEGDSGVLSLLPLTLFLPQSVSLLFSLSPSFTPCFSRPYFSAVKELIWQTTSDSSRYPSQEILVLIGRLTQRLSDRPR